MNDNVKFTKFISQTSYGGEITGRSLRYGLNLNVDTLGKAFYDAYIMMYLPNIKKDIKTHGEMKRSRTFTETK